MRQDARCAFLPADTEVVVVYADEGTVWRDVVTVVERPSGPLVVVDVFSGRVEEYCELPPKRVLLSPLS